MIGQDREHEAISAPVLPTNQSQKIVNHAN